MTKKLFASVFGIALLASCGNTPQPKAYTSELTSDDSLMIRMGQWNLTRYHSDKLGMDINYPSFLYHQELPTETCQELFVAEDVSISDLVDVGDNYSILAGAEEKWEYYGKVIDVDSSRVVTVMLRYYPEHGEAVEPIREWVNTFEAE